MSHAVSRKSLLQLMADGLDEFVALREELICL
jgi:hypothetical protein